MSRDFISDIDKMHIHYRFHDAMRLMNTESLRKFLKFRSDFLQEEINELKQDLSNPEEIVDALIDIIVVAVGTLNLFDVDTEKAWNEVLRANMEKKVGMKDSRKNSLGFPDLIKPPDWIPPNHQGNYGKLDGLGS